MRDQDLPHLLKLMPDESAVVQSEVQSALLSVASRLNVLLEEYQVDFPVRLQIHQRLISWRRGQLLRAWSQWLREWSESSQLVEDDQTGQKNQIWSPQLLESAHVALQQFYGSILEPLPLPTLLDELAKEIKGQPTFTALFPDRLAGNIENYYSPDNSMLGRVLSSGKGNPISLASLLILISHRKGESIRGCNLPAHFLAKNPESTQFYDCFRGEVHDPQLSLELRAKLSESELQGYLKENLGVSTMVSRTLRNLVGAYLEQEKSLEGNLFHFLYKDLCAREEGLGQEFGLREPVFHPGQLVSHKDKGFRGVIVDYRLYDNVHEGLPHEPLYRILVHGSPQVASARESRLTLDAAGNLVAHPFIKHFFSKFDKGGYVRNARPWDKS
jgi:hemimethylated DNA binding protein